MKCDKCKAEIKGRPKFCPECGEKNERYSSDITDICTEGLAVGFLMGRIYQVISKDEKKLAGFAKLFKDNPLVSDLYDEILERANFHLKDRELNEERLLGLVSEEKAHQ